MIRDATKEDLKRFKIRDVNPRHQIKIDVTPEGKFRGLAAEHKGELTGLYVAPPHRRQGVATGLLKSFAEQPTRLERMARAKPARMFYERHGYKDVGLKGKVVRMEKTAEPPPPKGWTAKEWDRHLGRREKEPLESRRDTKKVADFDDIELGDPMKLMPHIRRIHKLGHVKVAAGVLHPADLRMMSRMPTQEQLMAWQAPGAPGPMDPTSQYHMQRLEQMSGAAGESEEEKVPLELLALGGGKMLEGAQLSRMAERGVEAIRDRLKEKRGGVARALIPYAVGAGMGATGGAALSREGHRGTGAALGALGGVLGIGGFRAGRHLAGKAMPKIVKGQWGKAQKHLQQYGGTKALKAPGTTLGKAKRLALTGHYTGLTQGVPALGGLGGALATTGAVGAAWPLFAKRPRMMRAAYQKATGKEVERFEKKSYKLQGHTEVQGIPVAIENRKGSVRKGKDEDGHEWRTKMKHPYGYIKGTKGADGEEVDAYVGPDKEAPAAFVVHQRDKETGKYDEDKVMLGFKSKKEAKEAFLKHYNSPDFLGPISRVSMDRLRELVASKKRLVKISHVTYQAFLDELHRDALARGVLKEAQAPVQAPQQPQKPSLFKRIRKAGPGIGGLIGAGVGAVMGRKRGALLKGTLAGLGTGATLGWTPDLAASAVEGIRGR